MFLIPFLYRDAVPNKTNRKPIVRDCLTRRIGQFTFQLSIQLNSLNVQLDLWNNTTIGNWLRNYVHSYRNCRPLRYLLLPLLGLLLLLLVRFPTIVTVLLNMVGIPTFDTLRGCHPCLFESIGYKLFTRVFTIFSGIKLVGFCTGALRFRLRLLLLHTCKELVF